MVYILLVIIVSSTSALKIDPRYYLVPDFGLNLFQSIEIINTLMIALFFFELIACVILGFMNTLRLILEMIKIFGRLDAYDGSIVIRTHKFECWLINSER